MRHDQRDEPETTFDLLSNKRRRYALEYLFARDGSVEMQELTDYVAAREYDTGDTDLPRNKRKSVYTSLLQNHLPRLVEAGYIHRGGDGIEITESATRLEPYLTDTEATRPKNQWIVHYGALCLTSWIVVYLELAELLTAEGIPISGWTPLLAVKFTLLTVFYVYTRNATDIPL